MNDPKKVRSMLTKYFSIYQRPKHWIIECDKCSKRWSLDVSKGDIAGGNVLHLLNHAYGHEEIPSADSLEEAIE